MSRGRCYLITLITALYVIALAAGIGNWLREQHFTDRTVKVGFVYVGDESTPYTENFIRAEKALQTKLGDRVEILVKNNVPEGEEEEAFRELADESCDIIFSTSYGYQSVVKEVVAQYPDIEFCQATGNNANTDPVYDNYHTFMGEIYQGRYLSGYAVGMKLKEWIDEGVIQPEEAVIGYVGAYPYAEVISGYTAFLLGVREVVPEATMRVRYANTWSSYYAEKNVAKELIDEGCVVISQHSDTTGPAVACEEASTYRRIIHAGYNQSMLSVAPTTSLISCRINWEPYVIAATTAVLKDKDIESYVKGNVNGNDIGCGFAQGWVQMLELNELLAADGTQEQLDTLKQQFVDGDCEVFKGSYIGVNPDDPSDTIDLSTGYRENADSSAPTFHYILQDIITIEQ